ncbi:flagellin [Planosporangium flavigriseum]|uniref:flagellin N-terminal helical domain-containing protein n=1 Tax=Planosporangium flavigriseum TaxID=373681 RepID=UPI0031D59B05
MGLRINSNIAAMNAYRNLATTDKSMKNSLERLSSGLRINKAADDAAGLSISQGLQAQISGLQVAARNAQDGVNVVQTADGALTETSAILQRMRSLAVQAANTGSQDSSAQSAADTEFQQLKSELTRITTATKFGSQALLGGTYNGAFQVDSATGTGTQLAVNLTSTNISAITGGASGISGLDAAGMGLSASTVALTSGASATAAIGLLDTAIKGVSTVRATLGAYQNRFEHTINNINVAVENLSASKSAITDTDMALEMTNFSKAQILTQAGTAMLAQANIASQGVLKLLG